MLRVFKYPENPDQDKSSNGALEFGLQEGKSLEPLPFYTNGNNSAIISFVAVEFDQFRKEVGRIDLDTALIDVDSTNNIYNVDGLTEYASGLENGIYRFEFQNDSNLWITEYFNVKDFTLPYPLVIDDGNTVAWYIADDLTTITRDGGDFVSEWRDKLGSGHDLLQATEPKQPKWFLDDGILFDGIGNFMKTLPFTFEQPEQIYVVFKQITWLSDRYVFDGDLQLRGAMVQRTATPNLAVFAGSLSGLNPNLAINTFGIARLLFNGASSLLTINETTPITGNFGSVDMDGFTLGARGSGISWSNIQVKEIMLRKIADTAGGQADIYNYLKDKHSL